MAFLRSRPLSFALSLSIDHEINTAFRARFLRDKGNGRDRQDWYLSHGREIQRDFALLLNEATGATIDESLPRWPLQFTGRTFFSISDILWDVLSFVERAIADYDEAIKHFDKAKRVTLFYYLLIQRSREISEKESYFVCISIRQHTHLAHH